ncbi:MAG TPA: DNA replication and repair protein RecF [Bacteriovoracaceae bacterium]|nr:DNA replication and repair protein RecF [Bacteriovoracaceae bacterium]
MNCWKLKKLQARNFRNLQNSVFEFTPGINCIFGQNGNGKTNLLEAVHFLTNRKSFRKNTGYSQMINIEGTDPELVLQSVFGQDEDQVAYSLRVSEELDERYLNNKLEKTKTPSTCVFINPFDSYTFHTSGSYRRQWLDGHISLIDKEFRQISTRFLKALRFRNSILGMGGRNASDQLRAIDEQIADYSASITEIRLRFIKDLNEHITPTFRAIFDAEHTLELQLESLFIHWDAQKIYDYYRHNELSDIKSQVTQVGIHRDDYIFSFDGLNAFEFCSLGQQKMGFLSLIFAYIELFRYKFNSYPIVLIDDVSGELDSQRWKNLIQYLETKNFQVLITTANENFGEELEKINNSKKFTIELGKLV